MPYKQNNIYNDEWALGVEQKRLNTKIAYYRLRQINKLHQIKGIKRILDLGCGTGILVDLLTTNGYVVDGVDSSQANIDYARHHKKGNYFLQDIESFDTRNKYDLIIASHLIEHLRTPEKFLKKVKSSLKKGAFLYIATPNLSAWSAKSLWRENLGGISGTDHRILYSSKGLSRLLSMYGFRIIYISTKTRFNRMLEEIIRTIYFKKFKAHVRQELNNAGKFYPGYSTSITEIGSERSYLIRALKKLYNFIKNSVSIDLLFFIPNKISETKNRGEELIIIGRV
ncbi:MAG: class I SAM-dependent methyltransferase [Nitrospinales bacterium]